MAERKLKAWMAAGIIDGATAQRIRAYEAEHSRPLALWAVVGLAVLSIGLGVISVVAANWDAIPGETRLAVHGALLAALAGLGGASRKGSGADAVVFLFALLGLAFLGHLGQVYQTSSPTWMALALWLGLFGPALLVLGQGWLCAALLVAGCAALPWFRSDDPMLGRALSSHGPALIRMAAECVAPVALVPLAVWGARGRSDFWRRVEQLAMAYAVGTVSLLVISAAFEPWGRGTGAGYVLSAIGAVALGLGLAGALAWALDRGDAGTARGAALGLLALAVLASYPLSGTQIGAGLVFLALWSGLAMVAM